jgi:hypothetical protein
LWRFLPAIREESATLDPDRCAEVIDLDASAPRRGVGITLPRALLAELRRI